MNTKWYVGTLLIILAFIGLNQEQSKVANQQIVLQFADAETTSGTNLDDALATITTKLEALGISNIEILEDGNKQLSIRYYSEIDASQVGEFLSDVVELPVLYDDINQFPFDSPEDNLPESYSLEVVDLQQQTDYGLGLNGKLAFKLNRDYNSYYNPVLFQFNTLTTLEQDDITRVAYKIHSVIAIAIDHTSHVIPEVRAGPYWVYG